ncbi:phospholipase/carboxylesterase [Thiomicrorhabdus immobilis]|uniref:Phospholipase/carboxylesterase n=1 Tax=Thiomicrorhabdus immobilis TaxID=2791037 RepID=A0ABN6CYF9_9GAMM|nr:dienelactone hydrolase family protein [Thiomicrorhabdus immobilis]BCN94132.1 phospholipase/carboxylesterase [Thiomicrorhabdus immobilis]
MNKNYNLADLDPSIVVEPAVKANAAVIWLHGLGADGHDFENILPQLGLPNDHAIRFVFPHAPVQPVTVNGGMMMRSWYDILSMDIADRVDINGVEQSANVVNDLIAEQISQGIPAQKIVLAGFSQGGLVVLHAGLNCDENLAGILALSTYYPEPCFNESSLRNHALPIFMAHGRYDQVIPLSVAEDSKAFLESKDFSVDWHSYPMEHSVCMQEVEQISAWLQTRLLE